MSGTQRLVVVGGVAAGMSAASQAKRRQPDLEVVVFEQGRWVSYGACGMPYNIQDPQRAIDDLVVITPERFRSQRHIDVRINHRVEQIDLAGSRVRVQGPHGASWEGFDRLVLATGCRARLPGVAGERLPGVFALHTLDDAARIKEYLRRDDLRRAVIVGGGHIGLEMADVLTARGLAVTLLKRSPHLPPGYPDDISNLLRAELNNYGVEVRSGISLLGIEGDDRVRQVHTDQGRLPADLVLLAVGVEPNVELARAAGIRLGDSGAIAVAAGMATSAEGVWAAGDCAEAYHRQLRRGLFLPRGTTANKQGRIAGANASGADESFSGVLGTSVTKVFGLAVGHTGLLENQVAELGLQPAAVAIKASTRAHAYPEARQISVRLVFDPSSGKLLGGQIIGGEAVAKRLDVLAAAIQADWTIDDLAGLDASYAPPFAPVWDPLLVAANVARKQVR